MKKLKKCCHKWILDSLAMSPPFIVLFLCIFGSVFSIGFWSAHWIHKISLGNYKFYDVASDNIGGYKSLNTMNTLLPIDVVYTWVNGSDPYVRNNVKQMTKMGKFSCSHANCYQSPYYAIEIMNNSQTLHQSHNLIQVSEVHKGNISKKFEIFRGDEEFIKKWDAEFNNSISIHQAHWTSDTKVDWGLVWKKGLIIVVEVETELSVEISNISPTNYESFTKDCRVTEHYHTFIVECLEETLAQNLVLDIQNYNTAKKRKFPKVWEANLVLYSEKDSQDFDINRFEDNEELRYSLRSLERFAPWVRRVFVVTSGQIPSWLNLDHDRLRIITHPRIFAHPDHLPTFSSPAIEAHIHRIPGLSEHFLYLNDDIMLGDTVWPDDFFSPSTGYKIYLSWSLPECSSGCPGTWISDGFCDPACNTSACHWDGGDCSGAAGDDHRRRAAETDLGYDVDGGGGEEEEDLFPGDAQLCSSSCADAWLADSYCDVVCNSLACGFDGGDCGLEVIRENVPRLPLDVAVDSAANATLLTLPKGVVSAWVDVAALAARAPNCSLRGSYSAARGVRVVAASAPLGALVLVFKANASGALHVELECASPTRGGHKIQFYIEFNTYPVSPVSTFKENLNNSNVINFSFENVSPKIFNGTYKFDGNETAALSNYGSKLGSDFIEDVKTLHDRYVNGELTERGFKWKKILVARTHSSAPANQSSSSSSSSSRPEAAPLEGGGAANIRALLSVASSFHSDLSPANEDGALGGTFAARLPRENNLDVASGQWNLQTTYNTSIRTGRRLLDTFADSLLYVNRLYNMEYGFEARKVPAHMPHLMSKTILAELLDKFSAEFYETSSHKVRQSNDMQFAFSYFYYIMSEKKEKSVSQVFDEFDTDLSGTWSDRELRTFLARTHALPLHYAHFARVHDDIRNCTRRLSPAPVPTPPYERYADSDVPTVSKELVLRCAHSALRRKLDQLRRVDRFAFTPLSDAAAVHFKMITSNVSSVLHHLDHVRKNPRKFICINSNLDPGSANNELVRALVQDTYESLYPLASSFELPFNYRNRFAYTWQLEEWQRSKNVVRSLIYAFLGGLVLLTLAAFFSTEIESLKRWLCKRRRRRKDDALVARV